MNEQDLREIGVNSLGARRKFLSTIEYFQTRSNHYRISEEFLVNTWVVKQDLNELKVIWEEIARKHAVPVGKTTVDEMVGSMTFWCRFLDGCSHVTLMI